MRRSARVNGRTDQDEGGLVFLWESLGPSHHDRLRAVIEAGHRVRAISLFERSDVYDWEAHDGATYDVVSLAKCRSTVSTFQLARRIFDASKNADAAFLCHYNEPAVFLAARNLRARGVPVFTMIDSMADRRVLNPLKMRLKRLLMGPYTGAIVAGERSADYARQLGVPERAMASHYNTLDIVALQQLTAECAKTEFAKRPFLVVARLIPEKNLHRALEAFALYVSQGGRRRLSIIGEGPEEASLGAAADRLGLGGRIEWRGALPRIEVAEAMRNSLALLLPSISETYGIVVIEALAQGLPVIVSERAGVVDLPINDGVEGLVIDPENANQIADALHQLDRSEEEWREYSDAAIAAADRGDTRHFVRSVERLAGLERG